MKEQLGTAIAAARTRLRPAHSFVRAHRFRVECASVTLFGILAAVSVGSAALGRTTSLEARAADLERAEQSLQRWRTELQPPAARESLGWRESEQTLRSLGAEGARALSVARLVALRAEEVGIRGLRVQLLGPESVLPIETVQVGDWIAEPAGEGLSVEFDGNVADVIGLLGSLPPQAALAKMEMSDSAGFQHVRVVLATRRVASAP